MTCTFLTKACRWNYVNNIESLVELVGEGPFSPVCVMESGAVGLHRISVLGRILTIFLPSHLNDFMISPPPPAHLSVCLHGFLLFSVLLCQTSLPVCLFVFNSSQPLCLGHRPGWLTVTSLLPIIRSSFALSILICPDFQGKNKTVRTFWQLRTDAKFHQTWTVKYHNTWILSVKYSPARGLCQIGQEVSVDGSCLSADRR